MGICASRAKSPAVIMKPDEQVIVGLLDKHRGFMSSEHIVYDAGTIGNGTNVFIRWSMTASAALTSDGRVGPQEP